MKKYPGVKDFKRTIKLYKPSIEEKRGRSPKVEFFDQNGVLVERVDVSYYSEKQIKNLFSNNNFKIMV
eukprot:TRINITY_DN42_c1_g1_i1.p2 TRINITY_DN42_c1_g1~~TRINITY_DN42_c1_g1_i1.p2  ORF type:complete len:68 (-),score=7.26 TRINITY_DN42_c1_g1_i1:386-589(-)